MLKDDVAAFIKKHQLLKQNATVLVAVSGGPDSMALLHYFKTIRNDFGLSVIAVSVNHMLRGKESQEDLTYVKNKCKEWDIEFVGTSIDVNKYKEKERLGTQIAARNVRYAFFREQMMKYQADYLAFGHHGDDQVETMLMRLVRITDSSLLTGMPVKRSFAGGEIIRPFLCLTKEDIIAYCQEHGILPRLDPSNESTDYTRNYYRKKIIPLLKDKNPNVHKTIQYLSESLEADKAYIQIEAEKMVKEVVQFEKDPTRVAFQIDGFTSRATALQRRAYHLILNYLYHNKLPKDLSYVHEEQFFALMANPKGNVQIDFPRHLKVEKAYNKLIFYFQSEKEMSSDFHKVLPIPGEVLLDNGSKISATYVNAIPKQHKFTYICSEMDISLPLHVRNRRAGDRMSWQGLNGTKKLKDIFIDAKIPVQERNRWPIVTDNKGDIIWLVGLKKRDSIPEQKKSIYIQLTYEGNL